MRSRAKPPRNRRETRESAAKPPPKRRESAAKKLRIRVIYPLPVGFDGDGDGGGSDDGDADAGGGGLGGGSEQGGSAGAQVGGGGDSGLEGPGSDSGLDGGSDGSERTSRVWFLLVALAAAVAPLQVAFWICRKPSRPLARPLDTNDQEVGQGRVRHATHRRTDRMRAQLGREGLGAASGTGCRMLEVVPCRHTHFHCCLGVCVGMARLPSCTQSQTRGCHWA